MTSASWVVGASGLLGSALTAAIADDSTSVISPRVRWANAADSLADLDAAMETWLSTPGADRFRLYWAAGAGVTSTAAEPLAREQEVFEEFCSRLAARLAPSPELASRVSIFLSSSAGGAYSGALGAPFTEGTPPTPVTHYGQTKLAMESALTALVASTGSRAVIGRISTLYGPGQRIDKPQGFISHLCKSMLTNRPMHIYVSLDTLRDYLHVDDAATVIAACMDRLDEGEYTGRAVVKNLGSHVSVTIGRVLHEARLVFKRAPTVALATSEYASGQVHDLRIASSTWPELNLIERRTLLVGLAQTKASMQNRLNASGPNAH